MTDQRQELRRRVAEAIDQACTASFASKSAMADAAITVCAKAFAEVADKQSPNRTGCLTAYEAGFMSGACTSRDAILAYTNDSPTDAQGEG